MHNGSDTRRHGNGLLRVALVFSVVLPLALAGCVDEKVVFQERPLFEDPSAAANGFLGYQNPDQKLTVCGNCHVGKQGAWEGTAHASAWEGLQSSEGAQEFCEGCHTVNELGNASEAEAGWVSTGDPRYHDVQCESCHNAGLEHVENPDASQPLAPFSVGVDADQGCGECHSGAHHPFVEQWSQSAHGQVPSQGTPLAVGSFCLPCHEGKSALRNVMGETSNFLEAGGDPQPITCAVCHDPHPEGTSFAAQLRAPIEEASREHLCVRCHSREGTPSTGDPNVHGPHAFQGLLVLGEDIGWIPPGSDLQGAGEIVSTHGTGANPELCATCHVSGFTVTDTAGDEFHSAGHTFNAIPCTDESGIPTGADDCELSARTFEACATSGCHGDAGAARSAFITVRNRVNDLLDELWTDTDEDHRLETSDGGLLPQVLAQQGADEINPFDSRFTTAEGAMWNAQVSYTHDRPHWGSGTIEGHGDEHFGSHKGSGEGVHNPFLIEALLRESIRAVEDQYGVSASASLDLSPRLEVPSGVSLED